MNYKSKSHSNLPNGFFLKAFNIAIYISGSGSNFKAILNNTLNGYLASNIKLVFSSNEEAGGLQYALKAGIETSIIKRNKFANSTEFAKKQLELLNKHKVDLIILAGYMKKISPKVIENFKGQILNIHPALLPKYGGRGMYGMNVHEAVLKNKERKSGATIHFVDKIYDNGQIFMQKEVIVHENDFPVNLQQRVLKAEHELYSAAIRKLEKNN